MKYFTARFFPIFSDVKEFVSITIRICEKLNTAGFFVLQYATG